MASLIRDKARGATPGHTFRILFTDGAGDRQPIYLGRSSLRVAEEWRSRVEQLVAAKVGGVALSADLAAWLRDLPEVAHAKLAHVGLVGERVAAEVVTLAKLVEAFVSRTAAGAVTVKAYKQTTDSLLAFYGPQKAITEITAEDADGWRNWIAKDKKGTRKIRTTPDNRLAPATVAKRSKVAKQVFATAVRWGWLVKSPFELVRIGSNANPARSHYVPAEVIADVMDTCPGIEWRVVVALCRWGGLRCPSEVGAVTWGDVNWAEGRLTVRSKKTEHHGADHAVRVVPIQPALRAVLDEAWEQAADRSELIAPKAAGRAVNLGTQLNRIIRRAGHKPWPRLLQNLRASCATDWVEKYPAHVCAKWLGHSPAVAAAHYLQAREHHFEDAVGAGESCNADCNAPNTQNATPQGVRPSCTEVGKKKKTVLPKGKNTVSIEKTEGTEQKYNGAAGTRTQDQRIKSPML